MGSTVLTAIATSTARAHVGSIFRARTWPGLACRLARNSRPDAGAGLRRFGAVSGLGAALHILGSSRTRRFSSSPLTTMSKHPLINKPAPTVTLPDSNGESFTFTPGQQGKPAIVFFVPSVVRQLLFRCAIVVD
jgi:hypothetical protein